MASDVRFDFSSIEDIPQVLQALTVPSHGKRIYRGHLATLDQLATELGAGRYARENARRLATGYDDLVVVLLEPTDKAETHPYADMFAASDTLQYVDAALRFAFEEERSVENTIILDVRSFRSNKIRKKEEKIMRDERDERDEMAYAACSGMLRQIQPRVILVCQCQTAETLNGRGKALCSSTGESGRITTDSAIDGVKAVIVSSFHPMYFRRASDISDSQQAIRDLQQAIRDSQQAIRDSQQAIRDSQQAIRDLQQAIRDLQQAIRYLFDATFIVAANVFAGRRVSGLGLENLKQRIKYGPHTMLSITDNDITPSEVIESIEKLSGNSELESKKRLQLLLDSMHRDYMM